MTDRYKRLAPLSGVVFVALMVTIFFLPSAPDTNASGAKVIAFYRHHHTAIYVAAIMLGFAAATVTLYLASVADFLRRSGSTLLATTTVIGAGIAGAGMLLGAGAVVAVNDGPQNFTPDVARTLNILQSDLLWPMALGGLAIATLSMGVSMLRTHALPKALGIITTIVGVVACSVIGSWFAFLAMGPLTLVIAGYVYQRLGTPTQITMPDVPAQARAEAPTEVTA